MRYRFLLSRVQTAERSIRAADEEAALQKLRTELQQPYALIGGWQQSGEVSIELLGVEDTYQGSPLPADKDGPLLLSVKDAATYLGISRGLLYELINSGEIQAIFLGRRRLIPRSKLHEFIEQQLRNHGHL